MKRLLFLLIALLSFAGASAAGTAVPADTLNSVKAAHPGWKHSWSESPVPDPAKVVFAWGAEAGSSIDMSGSDMSSIDFNASFGMRYKWINYMGLGLGANIMIANSCRTYPLFVVFRTDFSQLFKIVFLDIRGGLALNYLPGNVSQRGAYASASIGFNLAKGKTFRSYITAGYTFVSRKDVAVDERITPYDPVSSASIRLGIAF